MPPRLILASALALALSFGGVGCAFAPDRWAVSTERDWDTNSRRPTQQKITLTLSGPISPFHPE